MPNDTAHLPGRDTNQRQRQAGEQRKTNHAAGSGAASGSMFFTFLNEQEALMAGFERW
jgi:hypothetical protein